MDLADHDYLKRIHQDALQVLEEVGVRCASEEIRRVFEETGLAAFDETTGHLHVLAPLVEQALGTAPKRDQYWIPENAFGVGGTAPFVYDERTRDLVEPTFDHLVRIAKIVDEAEEVR
ncbi:MAG: trimethylamine methyltransferase family protein, partial [Pseudomonadota bacterium]